MKEKKVKTVSLCQQGSCCPVVRLTGESVEIGEKDNLCILTEEQWEILKEKILCREI